MSPRLSARDYSINIDRAQATSKPPVVITGGVGGDSADAVLHITRVRPSDPDPEPVDTSLVNGREPQEWEEDRITEARLAQRARAATLLDGCT